MACHAIISNQNIYRVPVFFSTKRLSIASTFSMLKKRYLFVPRYFNMVDAVFFFEPQ